MIALAAAGLVMLLIVLPELTGAGSGASPRVAAGTHVVSLLGWGLLPPVWLACLGGAISSWAAGVRVSGASCLFGLARGDWQLLGYLPAAAALGLLGWQALRVASGAHRAELRGAALAGSARAADGGGWVWVVPSPQLAAFAAGLWRPRAVVTSGLLGQLNRPERRAVCAHEAAHVRLGHPRLLLLGGAVAAAYGALPPVRRSWHALRRELEAAADDEAVRAVGPAAVLSALVQVTLAATPGRPGTAAFAEAEHLRFRLSRLQDPKPVRPGPTAAAGSAAALMAAALAWAACLLAGAHISGLGVLGCLGVISTVGLRPTWARERRTAGPAEVGRAAA